MSFVKFQLVVDCADPNRLAHFWAEALGYRIEPPPSGFENWWSYWRSRGLADEENYDGDDSIVDPSGAGPRIWFHQVPERKVVRNRLHLDLGASGGQEVPLATRKERIEAEAVRLVRLGATRVEVLHEPGLDHYAVGMEDPEGNEFDVN
ncbi:MAG: VOC family protein [Thermoplasmata archaeon]|nr:VOC family protein [Thermoplasmata archaeon]